MKIKTLFDRATKVVYYKKEGVADIYIGGILYKFQFSVGFLNLFNEQCKIETV